MTEPSADLDVAELRSDIHGERVAEARACDYIGQQCENSTSRWAEIAPPHIGFRSFLQLDTIQHSIARDGAGVVFDDSDATVRSSLSSGFLVVVTGGRSTPI